MLDVVDSGLFNYINLMSTYQVIKNSNKGYNLEAIYFLTPREGLHILQVSSCQFVLLSTVKGVFVRDLISHMEGVLESLESVVNFCLTCVFESSTCSVWVARRPPGYAFIDFDDRRDAQDAIRELDGMWCYFSPR